MHHTGSTCEGKDLDPVTAVGATLCFTGDFLLNSETIQLILCHISIGNYHQFNECTKQAKHFYECD